MSCYNFTPKVLAYQHWITHTSTHTYHNKQLLCSTGVGVVRAGRRHDKINIDLLLCFSDSLSLSWERGYITPVSMSNCKAEYARRLTKCDRMIELTSPSSLSLTQLIFLAGDSGEYECCLYLANMYVNCQKGCKTRHTVCSLTELFFELAA